MDIVQKSISAIQQAASSLGKRVTSNFNWAGQQAQQNIVQPVQKLQTQFQQTAVPAFNRGFNDAYTNTYRAIATPIVSNYAKLKNFADTQDKTGLTKQYITEPITAIGRMMDPKIPLLSREGLSRWGEATYKSLPTALTIAAAPATAPRVFLGSGAIGGGFGALSQMASNAAAEPPGNVATLPALKRLVKGVPEAFGVGAARGAVQAPVIGKIAEATNPIIYAKAANILSKFPNLSNTGKEIISRVAQGVMSVPQGMLMAKSLGLPYDFQSALIDFAAGSGLARKTGDIMVEGPYGAGTKGSIKLPEPSTLPANLRNLDPVNMIDNLKNIFNELQTNPSAARANELNIRFRDISSKLDQMKVTGYMDYIKGAEGTGGFANLNEPIGKGYTTEPVAPASQKDLTRYAKVKTIEEIANSTPLNLAKVRAKAIKNEVAQYDQKLAADVDKIFGNVKLKTKDIVNPFESVQPGKGTYTKVDLDNLNAAYRNVEAGLPPGGLEPLPKKQQRFGLFRQGYDRLLNEGRNVLNKMGPAGQEISRRIDEMYTQAQRSAGTNVSDLQRATGNMDNANFEELTKALRGIDSTMDINSPAVIETRNILNRVRQDAINAGLDVGKIENYFPQVVDPDKLKGLRNETAQYLVSTKQFKTFEQAAGFLDDIINGSSAMDAYSRFVKPLPKKMGNLEFERVLDLPDNILRTDKKVLADYIEQAYSRIEQVKQFGKNNEVGDTLLSNLTKQGYDKQLAQQIVDQNLGLVKYGDFQKNLSKGARVFQAATKLPLFAITNATQTTNTMTSGGIRRTLTQLYQYANPEYRAQMDDYALRTGATLKGQMQQIMEQWKGGSKLLDRIIGPFGGKVETFNRVIAANTGKSMAEDLLVELKRNPTDINVSKDIQKLIPGIDLNELLANGAYKPEDLLKAGQRMVDITQFQTRPIDLPATWNTPIGKMLTQFKSFGFRQADFVNKEVLKPLTKGNAAPLGRFLLVGILLNEISNNLKSVITRKDRPEDIVQRIIEDIPGMGYYQDFVETLAYGMKSRDGLFGAIFDFVTGPTGSDIRKFTAAANTAMQGNLKPLAKESLIKVPFVGRALINSNPQIFAPGAVKSESLDSTNVDEFTQTLGTSILDKQKLSDQISEIKKQQKEIGEQTGLNIPLYGTVNQMSDQEKVAKMNDLQASLDKLEAKKDEITSLEKYQEKLGAFSKIPTSAVNALTQKYDAVKLANSILEDTKISEDKKFELINKLPISYQDVIYYNSASMPTEIKEIMIQEEIQKLIASNKADTIPQYLASLRRSVAGKMMATDTILNRMAANGDISYDLANMVKNTSVGSSGNFTAKAKVSKPKKAQLKKFAIRKVRAAKAPKSAKIKAIKIPKFKALKTPKIKVLSVK